MKNLVIIVLTIIFMGALFAEEDQNTQAKSCIPTPHYLNKTATSNRLPETEMFIVHPPVQLMFSYNDYFMGGYKSIPIRMQSDHTGMYMVYHGQETTQSASRKIYWNYIQEGQSTHSGRITTDDLRQGFPSIAIDPVTHNPFVAWHGELAAGSKLDVGLVYDQYSLFNMPNMWSMPQVVINNENGPDEFIWPTVFVGTSPLGGSYRRLYVFAENSIFGAPTPQRNNPKLAYTDFTTEMLEEPNIPFIWTTRTIPQFEDWTNQTATHFVLPQYTFFCKDSKIGFMGYLTMDSLYTSEPDLFVLYNDNYGEGDFNLVIQNSEIYVTNPMNYFAGEDTLFFAPINTHNTNCTFDNFDRLHMINCWGLQTPGGYYPDLQYVKDVQFDFSTNQFSIHDIEPKGADDFNYYNYESDGHVYLPWDEDNNGIIDEIGNNNGQEYPKMKTDFPFYWWDEIGSFSENNFRIVGTPNDHNLVAVWQNSKKSRQFHEFEDPEYADWENVPEVVVEISYDNGSNWSPPFYINSLDNPDFFGGMIPEYIYPCDIVESRMGENGYPILTVHFMFYNDLSYGSFIQSNGENIGGYLYYMSVDFEFQPFANADNIAEVSNLLKQNYPNPFNPTTTIAYTNPKTQEITLNIYNAKGQLVRNLVNEVQPSGDQEAVWTGLNNSNEAVTSGIYFYKLTAGTKTEMKKMVLIK